MTRTISLPTAKALTNPGLIRLDAYQRRFSAAERNAIELAAAHDPAATTQAKADAAEVRAIIRLLFTSEVIDVSDSATTAAVNRLQALGLIASGRPATINAFVAAVDRP